MKHLTPTASGILAGLAVYAAGRLLFPAHEMRVWCNAMMLGLGVALIRHGIWYWAARPLLRDGTPVLNRGPRLLLAGLIVCGAFVFIANMDLITGGGGIQVEGPQTITIAARTFIYLQVFHLFCEAFESRLIRQAGMEDTPEPAPARRLCRRVRWWRWTLIVGAAGFWLLTRTPWGFAVLAVAVGMEWCNTGPADTEYKLPSCETPSHFNPS